jgi:hypothetical protein
LITIKGMAWQAAAQQEAPPAVVLAPAAKGGRQERELVLFGDKCILLPSVGGGVQSFRSYLS